MSNSESKATAEQGLEAPKLKLADPLEIGSVVLPASNGLLSSLGFRVEDLGLRALGVTLESRRSKCLVAFVELNIQLWMERRELADVRWRAERGDAKFAALVPRVEVPQSDFTKGTGINENQSKTAVPFVWILSTAFSLFPVRMSLGFEKAAALEDIWDKGDEDLAAFNTSHYSGPVACLSLGIEELKIADFERAKLLLAPHLLFARFLPAGMHKLELALYFAV